MLRRAPLTWGQQLLWLGTLASPPERRSGHTVVRTFDVPAGASTAMVSSALAELVERHETLRTTFHLPADGEAYQAVHPAAPVPTRETCCADDSLGRVVDETTAELRTIGFDLAEPGLVRAVIVVVSDVPRHLVVATHHIVVDGWSWQVLRREFRTLVQARIDGVPASLPPVQWQPVDQAEYEGSAAGQRANAAALRYWDRRIAGMPDRVLPSSGNPVSAQHMATLRSPAAARALSWLGARYRVADSTLVLAVFGAVLGVVTGRDDSTVMTMAANRLTQRTRDLVACLAQYTAVHVDLSGDPTFAELLGRAGAAALTAYRHGQYDFQAMKAVEAEQARRRGVVFSQPAGLNFIRYAEPPGQRADPGPVPDLSTADSELRVEPVGGGCARGVVLLSVRPAADATELELLGDADALSTDELAALLRAVENLVVAGVTDADQRLSAPGRRHVPGAVRRSGRRNRRCPGRSATRPGIPCGRARRHIPCRSGTRARTVCAPVPPAVVLRRRPDGSGRPAVPRRPASAPAGPLSPCTGGWSPRAGGAAGPSPSPEVPSDHPRCAPNDAASVARAP